VRIANDDLRLDLAHLSRQPLLRQRNEVLFNRFRAPPPDLVQGEVQCRAWSLRDSLSAVPYESVPEANLQQADSKAVDVVLHLTRLFWTRPLSLGMTVKIRVHGVVSSHVRPTVYASDLLEADDGKVCQVGRSLRNR